MHLRFKFNQHWIRILLITWIYLSVAILITALYLVDRSKWESQFALELDNNTALVLNYASLCLSMGTVIITPLFSISIIIHGSCIILILMIFMQYLWLLLSIVYFICGATKLFYSFQHDSNLDQQFSNEIPLAPAPFSLLFLTFIIIQIWFIRTIIAFKKKFNSITSPDFQVENGNVTIFSLQANRNLTMVSPPPSYTSCAVEELRVTSLCTNDINPPTYEEVIEKMDTCRM